MQLKACRSVDTKNKSRMW